MNKKFDSACLIGLKILAEYELKIVIDKCSFSIDQNFSSSKYEEYKNLREEKLQINIDLRNFLIEATIIRGNNSFKTYKDVAKLNNPNFLISKPIISTLALRNSLGELPTPQEWNN